MPYQRILTIQDISCVGQCSMTIALPVMSACGHEVCMLPSALLSTHTGGFDKPCVLNLTSNMEGIWRHWKREGIVFDAIYTGYLGSVEAVRAAEQIMDEMLAPNGRIIVDPAMADHGKLYAGLSQDYAEAMSQLCLRADVMLPNITEAAMITKMPYFEEFDESYVCELLHRLGGKVVVLTGVGFNPGKTGAAMRYNGQISYYFHERVAKSFHGTGDIFASAFTGALLQEKSLEKAVQIAADYTCTCIQRTVENPAHWYGVKFEAALLDLIEMLK